MSLTVLAPSAASARELKLGLFDYAYPSSGEHQFWLDRSWEAGARLVEVGVSWPVIAPMVRAPGFDPDDPADPGYSFGVLDTVVREASARGFEVVFFVFGAPSWAEGPNEPGASQSGWWRPDPAQFGRFTRALASRYSGTFPDPLNSRARLPHVRYYRIWNEPNLSIHLTPQWVRGRPVGPDLYRDLLNAAYAPIKAVNRRNVVIAGGLGPYGDQVGEERMRPITFLRRLFCLRPLSDRRARGCGPPARFDILSHHPINQFAPWRSAANPLDATTPDLGRIRSLLRVARRVGTVRPRGPKPFWVTEFWWVSNPPSSFGVPPMKQARWLEYALYLFWQQRVEVAIWLAIRDPEPSRDSVGLGLYFNSGEPKPALRAYRFPFVAELPGPRSKLAHVWGRVPTAGTVLIQRQAGRAWRTVKRIRRPRAGVFTASIRVRRGTKLRAKLTPLGITSLPWTANVAHRNPDQ